MANIIEGDVCKECGQGRMRQEKTFKLRCDSCRHVYLKACQCFYDKTLCAGCDFMDECKKRHPVAPYLEAMPMTTRELLDGLLRQGMTQIDLLVDYPGVEAPAAIVDGISRLRLNLSYTFRDGHVELGDDAIRATLSFPGVGCHDCLVPYGAIIDMKLIGGPKGLRVIKGGRS